MYGLLTKQAWSIKDLSYVKIREKNDLYTCGTKSVSRAGKIAPCCQLLKPSQREIRFILPSFGDRQIINIYNKYPAILTSRLVNNPYILSRFQYAVT